MNNLEEIFSNTLFTIGDFPFSVGNLTIIIFTLLLLSASYLVLQRRLLPLFFSFQDVSPKNQRSIRQLTRFCLLLILLFVLIPNVGLDLILYQKTDPETEAPEILIRVSHVFGLILIWQLARLADLLLSKIYLKNIFEQRERNKQRSIRFQSPEKLKQFNSRAVQSVVYLVAIIFIVGAFNVDGEIFSFKVGENNIQVTVSNILFAVLVLLIAQLFNWVLIQLLLFRYYQRKQIDIGSQYAINQLLRYTTYVIAVIVALQSLGINMTLVWGGAAALLLGVGLGLQQTFNDFFSGVLLLLERSVEVGDVVDVGGVVGTVRRIGLRTSKVQTRDNIIVILPNSKLVVDSVINWSHNDNKARFHVGVGVAYGSDTKLVEKLLIEVAKKEERVLDFPSPFVRFVNFGNSSLDFELHFWSQDFIPIEDVKSNLRFAIDTVFREHDVTIPFPQRDLWFKNDLQQRDHQNDLGKAVEQQTGAGDE